MERDLHNNHDSGARVAAVIVAAGRGERAGQSAEGPKQYRSIGGRPVIAHTLDTFLSHPRISDVVVAIHADDEDLFRAAAPAAPTATDASRVTTTDADDDAAAINKGLSGIK